MTAPGLVVQTRIAVAAQNVPTDTATLFIVAPFTGGPIVPTEVHSLDEAVSRYGARLATNPVGYDCLDLNFKEGLGRAVIARAAATGATYATTTINDSAAAAMIVLSASGPGVWGNGLSVASVAGIGPSTKQIVVTQGGVEIERSPDLADGNAAFAWANNTSKYLTATLTGTPTNQLATRTATAMSGGTDGTLADSDYVAALARITKDWGPGQVAVPGNLSSTAQLAALAHAHTMNRFAILDAPNATTASTITAAAAGLSGADAPYGAMYAGWHFVSGVAAGNTRVVPPSCIVPGIIARNDKSVGTGQAPAGIYGESLTSQGLVNQFTLQSDLDALSDGNVVAFREMLGGVRAYDDVTLANRSTQAAMSQIGQVRTVMSAVARSAAAGENYVLRKVDGRNDLLSSFQAALAAALQPLFDNEDVYGQTFAEAVNINVGAGINPADRLAAGYLRAAIGLRVSPTAEHVIIDLVKTPITDTFGAAA
jgi:hypothetical protein